MHVVITGGAGFLGAALARRILAADSLRPGGRPPARVGRVTLLDKVAPPSWKEPANEVARELLPDPGDYRHHRGGEDNGDAHLKNLLVHHQVIVPVTEGRLDLGPWQAIFYLEFDGRRRKRLVIKVLGE